MTRARAIGRARTAARARAVLVAAAAALAALASPGPARAQEEDLGALAVPDTVFEQTYQPGPTYRTVYDRDRLRSNWSQMLSYFRSARRVAFNGSGNLTTQDFLAAANKSTFGDFTGHLDARLTRKWILSLDGRFDMNSTADATRKTGRRDNHIQIRTQYSAHPVSGMSLTGSAYTEFQQDHDRSKQNLLLRANPLIDPTQVDTLRVQQDSSYTSARQDGVSALASWRVKPWLDFSGSASASRRNPTQRSLVRDFINPMDGSGGGRVVQSLQTRHEPGDNSNVSSRLTFTRIPRSKIVLAVQNSSVNQTRFDQEFRDQEEIGSDRTLASAHFDHGPFHNTLLSIDASLVRSLQEYKLRRSSSSLVTTRQATSTLGYNSQGTSVGLTFLVSRGRSERQVSQNGIVLNRMLLANASRRISRRLAVDGTGGLNLQSSRYLDPLGDQDFLRSTANVGGGYLLTPHCSTSVHFSVNRTRNVSIDTRASAANNTQTVYQMNATMQFVPSRNFSIRQNYLLNADYKVLDYAEIQNYLNRVRRIDTDFIDSIFSFAFIRLNHSFIYRDNGGYFRRSGESNRSYRISLETYEQTLGLTLGIELVPGVRLIANQSLLNQRNYDLPRGTSTLRNRFSSNGGLEVNRTLSGGYQFVGAIRHIGGYDERVTPTTQPKEEDYWIAGVTFQKDF